MTSVRTMPLTATPFRRGAVGRSFAVPSIVIAVAVFLAVLIADVVIIAAAAPSIAKMDPSSITAM
jgi:hypothetical protein